MSERRRTNIPGVFAYPTKQGQRYVARWRDPTGKPHERGGFKTKGDAKTFKAAADGERVQGRHLPQINRETFGDYQARWWAAKKLSLSSKTVEQYGIFFRIHITPQFGDRRLVDI